MPHTSDPRFLVLHALRLKGLANLDQIADQTSMYPSEVRNFLDHLLVSELVAYRETPVTGWALTPAGRRRHAELITAEVEGSGTREAVDDVYRRWLPLNDELLKVCTDWQLRTVDGEQVINDHSDRGYDFDVIRRLRQVDEQVQPLCAELAEILGRFGPYAPRFSIALWRVRAGDHDWFTKPGMDSYHSVWFELHEDLLTTLGIERAAKAEA